MCNASERRLHDANDSLLPILGQGSGDERLDIAHPLSSERDESHNRVDRHGRSACFGEDADLALSVEREDERAGASEQFQVRRVEDNERPVRWSTATRHRVLESAHPSPKKAKVRQKGE